MDASAETDLVGRSRRGDRQAFALLVEAHTDAVYAFVRRRIGDADQAADLTQECFLRAWRGIAGFRGDCAFRTWLYRIALRLVATELERRHRRRALVRPTACDPPDPSLPGPGERLEAEAERADLATALAALPTEGRELLRLLYADGLSYEQISDLLALPLGTVKVRLHRYRQRLKEHLETLWGVARI